MRNHYYTSLRPVSILASLSLGVMLCSCTDHSGVTDPSTRADIASWFKGDSSTSTTPTIIYSTLTDPRDLQTYKTVVIGTQTWMAQNLNYTPTSGNSWCYANTASYCTTYGRLYDYATALTACPTGWHLPDTTAWNTLEAYVGGTATAGTALKANSTLWITNTGTDAYGFSALPAGDYNGSSFFNVGGYGYWWTATANGSSIAYGRNVCYGYAGVGHSVNSQADGFSARCLKDSP